MSTFLASLKRGNLVHYFPLLRILSFVFGLFLDLRPIYEGYLVKVATSRLPKSRTYSRVSARREDKKIIQNTRVCYKTV